MLKKGGKSSTLNRVYGYSDVIRNKAQSLTDDQDKKNTVTLIVCLIFICITYGRLTSNIGFPGDLCSAIAV